jgi:hypothetical protein
VACENGVPRASLSTVFEALSCCFRAGHEQLPLQY